MRLPKAPRIVRFLIEGKSSKFLIFYLWVGGIEIVSTILAKTAAGGDGYSLISALFGFVVCTPWIWILMAFPEVYWHSWWKPIIIFMVVLNAWLIWKYPRRSKSERRSEKIVV